MADFNEDLYMLEALLGDADEGDAATLRWFISAGLDVNAKDADGYTALHVAAMADWDETNDGRMLVLLEVGAEINALAYTQAGGPWTPLMLAAFEGRAGQVRRLLEWRADTEVQDDRGRTALMLAAAAAPVDEPEAKVRLLLEAGADPYRKDNQHLTALDRIRLRERDITNSTTIGVARLLEDASRRRKRT